jgi:hypothetical protein
LNRRHKDFQSSALPTELPSHQQLTETPLLSLTAKTTWYLKPGWSHRFKGRIGITFRDGAYSAQLRVNGVVRQIKLHAGTIPEAVKVGQDLNRKLRKGGQYAREVRQAAVPNEEKPVIECLATPFPLPLPTINETGYS